MIPGRRLKPDTRQRTSWSAGPSPPGVQPPVPQLRLDSGGDPTASTRARSRPPNGYTPQEHRDSRHRVRVAPHDRRSRSPQLPRLRPARHGERDHRVRSAPPPYGPSARRHAQPDAGSAPQLAESYLLQNSSREKIPRIDLTWRVEDAIPRTSARRS